MKCLLNPDEAENKTVPRQVFVRLKQELQEKNDTISTLQQKILHLENVMRLKDQRIDDLTTQIMRPSLERNAMSALHSHIANGKVYNSKLQQ